MNVVGMLVRLICAALLMAGEVSCAAKQGEGDEKSGIEMLTEETGRQAVEAIHKPYTRARAVEGLAKQRVEEMDGALSE